MKNDWIHEFVKIAPYLSNPLILIGFILLLLFSLFFLIIQTGKIPVLSEKHGKDVMEKILFYGFLIAIMVVIGGFSLEFIKINFSTKEVEIKKARQHIATGIVVNMSNLDLRIPFLKEIFQEDTFGQKLDSIRKRTIPSKEQEGSLGYRKLIAEQQVAALRQIMNSYPLQDKINQEIIEQSGINSDVIFDFNQKIIFAEDAVEFLFESILFTASLDTSKYTKEYTKVRLQYSLDNIFNKFTSAYITGLYILYLDSGYISANTMEKLSMITNFDLKKPIDSATFKAYDHEIIQKSQELLETKKQIVKETFYLRDKKLQEYADIEKLFKIKPTDTPNEVIGKAISLRQFGRITESVAAFSRYGEMFSSKDSTAEKYSQTAQKFTINCDKLNISGGVYIYEIVPDGQADKAGLATGDIIISINGIMTDDMEKIISILKRRTTDSVLKFKTLRLKTGGQFNTIDTKVFGDSDIGAGLMPI